MSKYISRASLIISNCIPLFGVFFFGWDLYSLFILYWAETLIIGFFAVIKILIQCKDSKIFSALFFILHFGLFMMFHLVFIFQILSNSFGVITGDSPFPDLYIIYINSKELIVPFIILFISHLISFFSNYIYKKEYLSKDESQFFAPYGRVILMHIVVIIGGFLSNAFHNHIYTLLLLVVIKTIVDLIFHNRQHRDKSINVKKIKTANV